MNYCKNKKARHILTFLLIGIAFKKIVLYIDGKKGGIMENNNQSLFSRVCLLLDEVQKISFIDLMKQGPQEFTEQIGVTVDFSGYDKVITTDADFYRESQYNFTENATEENVIKPLGCIYAVRTGKFVNYAYTNNDARYQNPKTTNLVLVITSPNCQTTGVLDTCFQVTRRNHQMDGVLHVLHMADETADSVITNLSHAIDASKDKAVLVATQNTKAKQPVDKLKHLNFLHKLANLSQTKHVRRLKQEKTR